MPGRRPFQPWGAAGPASCLGGGRRKSLRCGRGKGRGPFAHWLCLPPLQPLSRHLGTGDFPPPPSPEQGCSHIGADGLSWDSGEPGGLDRGELRVVEGREAGAVGVSGSHVDLGVWGDSGEGDHTVSRGSPAELPPKASCWS